MPEASEKLNGLLDDLDGLVHDGPVSLGEIVDAMGERSFATVLLIPALIMVSPISGIPGSPMIAGVLFALISAQMLLGRAALWLPGFLRRLSIRGDRLKKGVAWLRRPVARIDPLIRTRLTILTDRPASMGAITCCLGIGLAMPPMELLPFASSFASGTIALFAAGLMARDGVLVVMGYGCLAGLLALAMRLI